MNYDKLREMEDQVDDLADAMWLLQAKARAHSSAGLSVDKGDAQRVYSQLCSLLFFFRENPPTHQELLLAEAGLTEMARRYARLLGRTLPEFV